MVKLAGPTQIADKIHLKQFISYKAGVDFMIVSNSRKVISSFIFLCSFFAFFTSGILADNHESKKLSISQIPMVEIPFGLNLKPH